MPSGCASRAPRSSVPSPPIVTSSSASSTSQVGAKPSPRRPVVVAQRDRDAGLVREPATRVRASPPRAAGSGSRRARSTSSRRVRLARRARRARVADFVARARAARRRTRRCRPGRAAARRVAPTTRTPLRAHAVAHLAQDRGVDGRIAHHAAAAQPLAAGLELRLHQRDDRAVARAGTPTARATIVRSEMNDASTTIRSKPSGKRIVRAACGSSFARSP